MQKVHQVQWIVTVQPQSTICMASPTPNGCVGDAPTPTVVVDIFFRADYGLLKYLDESPGIPSLIKNQLVGENSANEDIRSVFNPLPTMTVFAVMVSHKPIRIYMGVLMLGVIL